MERVSIFNQATITPPDPQEVGLHLVEENTTTAIEVFLAVKTLKAADSDKIRPEMLKALSRGGGPAVGRCSSIGPRASGSPRHGVWIDCSFLPDTPCG